MSRWTEPLTAPVLVLLSPTIHLAPVSVVSAVVPNLPGANALSTTTSETENKIKCGTGILQPIVSTERKEKI